MGTLSEEAMNYLRKLLNEAEMPARDTGFRGMRRELDEADATRTGGGMLDNAESSIKFGADSAISTHPKPLRQGMEGLRAPMDAQRVTADVSRLAADKSNQLGAGIKGAKELKVPGETAESYQSNKMRAVRSAMGEQDPAPQVQGAPELSSATPMPPAEEPPEETSGSASPPPPGEYKAEGDPWTYEVGADGKITVSKDGGEPIPVEPGTKAYNAIAGQVKSGQLKQASNMAAIENMVDST
jgi:hypothetical protein